MSGYDCVWAGGDCVEVLNLVSGQYQHVPLGTHANKHGRVIAPPFSPVWDPILVAARQAAAVVRQTGADRSP